MKHVVEYKLHGGTVPYFIEDGGYFPDGGKLVGLTKDDVDCYVPPSSTLVTYGTLSDLITKVIGITMHDQDGNELTSDDKTTLATDWWNARVQA